MGITTTTTDQMVILGGQELLKIIKENATLHVYLQCGLLLLTL